MHRVGGEDDDLLLAISPPPEFQDLPAPPPTVFRDLSPSPSALLGVGGNKSRTHHPHYYHHLSEFAARISFDILNEAMVIATEEVLSHGGCTVRCGSSSSSANPIISTTHHNVVHTSGSSEEEETSITTSWEYVPKPGCGSKSAVRRSRCQAHTNNDEVGKGEETVEVNQLRHTATGTEASVPRGRSTLFCGDAFTSSVSSSRDLPLINRSVSFHSEIGPAVPPRVNIRKTNNDYSDTSRRNNNVDPSASSFSNRHSIAGTSNIEPGTISWNNIPSRHPILGPRRSCGNNDGVILSDQPADSSRKCFPRSNDMDDNGLIAFNRLIPSSSISKQHEKCRNGSAPLATIETVKVPVIADFFDNERCATSSKEPNTHSSSSSHHTINKPRLADPVDDDNDDDGNDDETLLMGGSRCAGRLNNPQSQARRSHSVEVKISKVDSYDFDTSLHNINSKEERGRVGASSTSTKQEKRTIGHSILNLFKRKSRSKARLRETESGMGQHYGSSSGSFANNATTSRALPPPPPPSANAASDSDAEVEPSVRISCGGDHHDTSFPTHMDLGPWSDDESLDGPIEAKDFTVSIEKVKDCGWYWGPFSSEAAEDLLRGEPDGSFIVRDSSDTHYIFSLTFKLNGLVRHCRIEHEQGNFSFGPLTRFKAATIVDFVEKAVAHSRSGRYLFFLHRRPILGPMRVQLLHPYSRFRHPRSLQHQCRFVILKYVRRDLISSLPLPKPLIEYLNTPYYYFEKQEDRKAS
ncbi:uncharacterized protein LOC110850105 isoform X2 [Folsomia candida]|uniref:uncharacterized protein LOC110850105 isoform X2 n=1 Tax=Folsomia candida TaxID=158441 RepID=UPI000B8F2EA1|nr:uncharacterized protein LOC110850105 isoform X2 [Folsomia candida]